MTVPQCMTIPICTTHHKACDCREAMFADCLNVVKRFRQKLATYTRVYSGDKELRSLLADCDAIIARATDQGEMK